MYKYYKLYLCAASPNANLCIFARLVWLPRMSEANMTGVEASGQSKQSNPFEWDKQHLEWQEIELGVGLKLDVELWKSSINGEGCISTDDFSLVEISLKVQKAKEAKLERAAVHG